MTYYILVINAMGLKLKAYGSINNRIEEISIKGMPAPAVGLGVTELAYSDTYARRIVRVSPTGNRFWMKPCLWKLNNQLAGTGAPGYDCEGSVSVRQDAPEIEVRRNRLGQWKVVGGNYCVIEPKGQPPREYRDPSL
jgi:hypothetical protein